MMVRLHYLVPHVMQILLYKVYILIRKKDIQETNFKATGLDYISQGVLKKTKDAFEPSFTRLFNLSVTSEIYLTSWK